MTTRILLVDGHEVVRQGLRTLLDKEADFEVVAEADTGEAAVRLVLETKPDVVILDLTMAGLQGLDPVHQLVAAATGSKVVGLSIYSDRRFVAEVARVLRKTGTLVIFTPHGKGVAYRPEDPYHVREYSHEEFRDVLSPYFSTIRWFGRRQGARLKAAERSMDSVRRYDPGGIRNLVPRPIRHWLGGLISRLQGGPTLGAITPQDIEYEEGVAADTNLIGICMK